MQESCQGSTGVRSEPWGIPPPRLEGVCVTEAEPSVAPVPAETQPPPSPYPPSETASQDTEGRTGQWL